MMTRPIKTLLPILLATLFTLNTLTVVAAETGGVPPVEPPTMTESVTDSGQPARPDEPKPDPETEPEETPDATPPDDSADSEQQPEDTVPEEPPLVWAEVDTFDELHDALQESTRGETTRLRLTKNITIPANAKSCVSQSDHPVELDLGPNTLYVEGSLTFQSGLTLMGNTGEDPLIHVLPGGEATINNVKIQAGNRCAVWQEEGAVLIFESNPDFPGEVHYAEKAVALPYSFISWKVAMPVAVVHDGQTLAEALPDTDNVQWFYQGKVDDDAYIAVDWDLDHYQTELDTRTRTRITGSYPDTIALQQPVCLVVFQNGNPAIFLDAYGMESNGQPKAKVKIELIEPELGCRFEWSQDGENWLNADAVETPSSDGRLAFTVSFPQDTPPAYPYYLSAVVDYPDGSTGYSDVLIIERADSQCDSGGNRHGGTGIAPPELPPLGGGTEDGGGTDDTTPNEPDDSEPPSAGKDEPDGTQLPVVNPPIENDSPQLSIPPTETPAAAAPITPHTVQMGDGITTSTTSTVQPEPSPSASQRTSDTALTPSSPTSVDSRQEMVELKKATEASTRNGAATGKAVTQMAVGIVATGGIITLTMTWRIWSKRLIDLLRRLLK